MQLLAGPWRASKEYTGGGGMVAWVPPRQVAESLALAGGEPPAELHLTLCFFPDWGALDALAVAEALERVSVAFGPLAGVISGIARFSLPEEDAVVALADVPGLGRLREALAWELRERDQEFSEDHGFTPHLTLAYISPSQARLPLQRLEPRDILIRSLTLFGPEGPAGELALGGAEGWKAGEDEPTRAGPFEDQRLAAEERLRRRVEKALGRMEAAVHRRLREESRQKALGDIPDDQIFWEAQRADFLGEMGSMPEELLAEGVAQAARLGLAVDFSLVSQSVADLAVDYSNSWWDALDTSTRDRMRTAIQRHIDSGAPLSQLRQELTPLFGRQRAELIASTEVTRLYAEGNRLGYANAGVEQVEWRTVVDGLVDPDCRNLHKERMLLGEEEHVPPAHPRCRCWLAPVVDGKPLTKIQYDATAPSRDLLEQAGSLEPDVTDDMLAISGELGGEMANLQFRLKSLQSMERKVLENMSLHQVSASEAAGRKRDALRYTILFSSEDYAAGVSNTLRALEARGYNVSRFQNYWPGSDYRGINTNLVRNDFTLELQFHTPESLELKERLHPLYEQYRTSRDPVRQAEVWDQMADEWRRFSNPRGAERLSWP